jgi:translation elongation factor EF-Tu-like GTPase
VTAGRYLAHIEAEIYFLRTEEGGRKGPAFTGYRPQFFYDGEDWDAVQEYPDVSEVRPGDTVRALVSFLSPEYHRGRVYPGMSFAIREGQRVVGRGRVLKILGM